MRIIKVSFFALYINYFLYFLLYGRCYGLFSRIMSISGRRFNHREGLCLTTITWKVFLTVRVHQLSLKLFNQLFLFWWLLITNYWCIKVQVRVFIGPPAYFHHSFLLLFYYQNKYCLINFIYYHYRISFINLLYFFL